MRPPDKRRAPAVTEAHDRSTTMRHDTTTVPVEGDIAAWFRCHEHLRVRGLHSTVTRERIARALRGVG